MTDLIKRLREADSYNKKYYALDPLHQEAADRIEQLNERLTAATDDAKEAEAYAEQLEAKLAECEARLGKAVEMLREIEVDFCQTDVALKYAIHTVLAELEK